MSEFQLSRKNRYSSR